MNDCEFYINHGSTLPDDLIVKYKGVFDNGEILRFHRSLPGYQPTPLYSLSSLAGGLNIGELWVKDESERMGLKAFKVLGASYAISKMLDGLSKDAVFCTATDGNHGKAVAWSARMAGRHSIIFMPASSVESRIHNIENEGAKVIVVGGDYDDAVHMAKEKASEKGWILVQDTSWDGYTDIPVNIMAGYSTVFREMEDTLHKPGEPAFDVVFLKAGVGSWAASAAWYYHERYREKRPKIVLVEPSSADCVMESKKRGMPVPIEKSGETMMAGLNCATASRLACEILHNSVDLFLSIPDWYAGAAMNALYYAKDEDEQIISGESGAAGLGGLLAMLREDSLGEARDFIGLSNNSRVLVFNTEGNTDPINFNKIIHGD